MSLSLFIRILLIWILFIPVPVANGLLREKWYKPIVGEFAAQQIGVAIVSAIFLVYAYVGLKGEIGVLSTGQLWLIGLTWLVLTLLFEFGIGIAAGRSWSYLLADYRIWEGRTWSVVLVVVLLSPILVKYFSK